MTTNTAAKSIEDTERFKHIISTIDAAFADGDLELSIDYNSKLSAGQRNALKAYLLNIPNPVGTVYNGPAVLLELFSGFSTLTLSTASSILTGNPLVDAAGIIRLVHIGNIASNLIANDSTLVEKLYNNETLPLSSRVAIRCYLRGDSSALGKPVDPRVVLLDLFSVYESLDDITPPIVEAKLTGLPVTM